VTLRYNDFRSENIYESFQGFYSIFDNESGIKFSKSQLTKQIQGGYAFQSVRTETLALAFILILDVIIGLIS
jgi:hypothetical protein